LTTCTYTKKSEINWGPLSDTIESGIPTWRTTCVRNRGTNSRAVIVSCTGIVTGRFPYRSTKMATMLCQAFLSGHFLKSTVMCCQGRSGTGSWCSSPGFLSRGTCERLQVWQLAQYRSISLPCPLISGRQTGCCFRQVWPLFSTANLPESRAALTVAYLMAQGGTTLADLCENAKKRVSGSPGRHLEKRFSDSRSYFLRSLLGSRKWMPSITL